MTKTVYKYKILHQGETHVSGYDEMEWLGVGVQDGEIVAWAVCDPEAKPVEKTLLTIFTGHKVEDNIRKANHLGTVTINHLVYHVFEKPNSLRW